MVERSDPVVRRRDEPSMALGDYWAVNSKEDLDEMIGRPETKGTGQPGWKDYARKAGITPEYHLGEVKIQILTYVDGHHIKGKRRTNNAVLTLLPERLSKNMLAKKRRERGEDNATISGYSPRTFRQAIKELVDDGYLKRVGRGPHGEYEVVPAWSILVTNDPDDTWTAAFARHKARLVRESDERADRRAKRGRA